MESSEFAPFMSKTLNFVWDILYYMVYAKNYVYIIKNGVVFISKHVLSQ